MMYNYLLTFHSWNRWLVVIFAVWAMYRNIQGLTSKRAFEATDRKVNAGFIGSLHLQALLGLILYFGLSPIVQMGLADMKGAMKNADLRSEPQNFQDFQPTPFDTKFDHWNYYVVRFWLFELLQ